MQNSVFGYTVHDMLNVILIVCQANATGDEDRLTETDEMDSQMSRQSSVEDSRVSW